MEKTRTIDPPVAANASIIWLHGLGASADDFVGLPGELDLGARHGVRFLLPNAPCRAVTVNDGVTMPAWYDIRGVDIAATQDADGIRASGARIAELIDAEAARGIAPERIVVGGFSQGGATALHAGLGYPGTLAGIVALSAYLPLHEQLETNASSAARATPIFMAHGEHDPVVPIALGRQSRDLLAAAGFAVTWRDWPIAHEVCAPEIAALRSWLDALGII